MAAKSMQETVTVEAFTEEIKTAVTSFNGAAKEERNAGNISVALTQDNLSPHINKDNHIVQSKPEDISAGLGPYFYKLPRELRDQIFSHLLVSGYPNFMCTSRAMEQEGKTWIAKKAIFRMKIGFCSCINYNPSQKIVDKIQNVTIAIKNTILPYSYLDQHPELKILDLFAGSTPHRKTCNVSIEFHVTGPTLFNDKVLVRLQCLTGFTGFEEVILRIGIKGTEGTSLIKPSDSYFDTPHVLKSWFTDLELARLYLQLYLGKTDLRSDMEGWSMIFNPRKAAEEGAIS